MSGRDRSHALRRRRRRGDMHLTLYAVVTRRDDDSNVIIYNILLLLLLFDHGVIHFAASRREYEYIYTCIRRSPLDRLVGRPKRPLVIYFF